MLMLALAVYMYYMKYRRCTPIPVMLFAFIMVLVTLIVMETTQKYIAGFFLMIYLANLFNFIGFKKILDNLRGPPHDAIKKKTSCYFKVMYVLYALTLLLAFIPRFGPFCRSDKVYPPCMNWTAMLFIINFIFNCVMQCKKDYFFSEGSILEPEVDFSAVGEDGKPTLDWRKSSDADKLAKNMFRR